MSSAKDRSRIKRRLQIIQEQLANGCKVSHDDLNVLNKARLVITELECRIAYATAQEDYDTCRELIYSDQRNDPK